MSYSSLRWPLGLLVLLCLCVIVWIWPQAYPRTDVFLSSTVVATGIVSVFVSAHAPAKLLSKLSYAALAIVLAVIGVKLTLQQSNEAASQQKQATQANGKLQGSLDSLSNLVLKAINTRDEAALSAIRGEVERLRAPQASPTLAAHTQPSPPLQIKAEISPPVQLVGPNGNFLRDGVTTFSQKQARFSTEYRDLLDGNTRGQLVLQNNAGKLSKLERDRQDADLKRDLAEIRARQAKDFETLRIEADKLYRQIMERIPNQPADEAVSIMEGFSKYQAGDEIKVARYLEGLVKKLPN